MLSNLAFSILALGVISLTTSCGTMNNDARVEGTYLRNDTDDIRIVADTVVIIKRNAEAGNVYDLEYRIRTNYLDPKVKAKYHLINYIGIYDRQTGEIAVQNKENSYYLDVETGILKVGQKTYHRKD